MLTGENVQHGIAAFLRIDVRYVGRGHGRIERAGGGRVRVHPEQPLVLCEPRAERPTRPLGQP